MKLGICAAFGFRTLPLKERLELARGAGFETTSLYWPDDSDAIRRLRERAPEIVRSAGLVIDNFHVPYRGCDALWSSDDDARSREVRRHVTAIDDCRRHGVGTMVMHVTLSAAAPGPNEAGAASLRAIVDAAEAAGVVVAIENTRCPDHVDYLLTQIESPHLGLCFDTGHDHLFSTDRIQLLKNWRHRLAAVHLSDTDGILDRHWLPGCGQVDFAEVARWFPEEFCGSLLLECVPQKKPVSPSAFLQDAYDSASRFRDRLRRAAA